MEVVIITGLSGAGKTKANDWFEDKGYYCIDNMPPSLIENFIDLSIKGNNNVKKAAFVMDIRGGIFFDDLKNVLLRLRANENITIKILFVDASNEAIVRRYNETRRSHPLATAATTVEVIEMERNKLKELRENADFVVDTTTLKTSELFMELDRLFLGDEGAQSFVVNIMSFGYKHGIPLEADWVIDVRFIQNPFYLTSLKELTGNNKKVQNYVLSKPVAKEFLETQSKLILNLIPNYIKEGKYSLTIAFGCTGGQHRSVTMANALKKIFSQEGLRVTLEHRDL